MRNKGRNSGLNSAIDPNRRQSNANFLDLRAATAKRRLTHLVVEGGMPYSEVECRLCAKLVRFYTFAKGQHRNVEFHYSPCGLPCGFVPHDAYWSNNGQTHGHKAKGSSGPLMCDNCGEVTQEVLDRLRRLGILKRMT